MNCRNGGDLFLFKWVIHTSTDLNKVNLLDEIYLNLDELSWLMKFKNKKAKDLMKFNFDFFSMEKKKTFGRLEKGETISDITILMQDIELKKSKERKEEVINEAKIII